MIKYDKRYREFNSNQNSLNFKIHYIFLLLFSFPPDTTVVQLDKNSKKPIFLPPNASSDGTYHETPVLEYDDELPMIAARRRSDKSVDFLDEDEIYPLPNVRRRRQNDKQQQARLLSQSAFNRISETLGALNTVGNFFLNITREANGDQHNHGDMQLISSSSMNILSTTISPEIDHSKIYTIEPLITTQQSIPDAFLTITKNVTKNIEPLIKRVDIDGNNTENVSNFDKQSLSEKIDMAALAEKKRKKHQAISPKKETISVSSTVSPGL